MNNKVKKAYREKYKALYGEYPEAKFVPGNGAGKQAHKSRKDGQITNQKGAFGKVKVQPTFDPNETNKMRVTRMRYERANKKDNRNRIVEGAKGLLTRVLGE